MADPLSVAGLAAGLVSLSFQLTSGITNYLDAVRCRAEELASAQGQNESLRQTIMVLQSTVTKTQPIHPESSQVIIDALKSYETELTLLEDLVMRLSGSNTNTWRLKLQDKSRKLRYAFDRSKVQQLTSRLSQTNTRLSIALQVLGVDVSQSNFDKLAGIENVSRDISTNLVATRSEVASLHHTVATSNQNMTTQLLDSAQFTQTLVSVTSSRHDDALQQITAQYNDIRQMLGGIAQRSDINAASQQHQRQPQTEIHMIHHLIEKPSVTKEFCDGFKGASTSSPNHWMTPRPPISGLQSVSSFDGVTCICHKKHTSGFRNALRTGALTWHSDKTSHGHWPSCPLARVTGDKHHRTFGVRYTGLAKLFKLAVEISFDLSYGAGGSSLSRGISFRPTVDEKSDPVFRIFALYDDILFALGDDGLSNSNLKAFLFESYNRILQSFERAKSTPFATDSKNNTITHKVAQLLRDHEFRDLSADEEFFCCFLQNLIDAGSPINTYNLDGFSPLGILAETCRRSYMVYNQLLVKYDTERRPIWANGDRFVSTYTIQRSFRLFDAIPGISESYGLGPLSNAIVSKNLVEVRRLLSLFPDMLRERNLLGHSPLHLAVEKPEYLSLLVEAAAGSSEILDSVDGMGRTPLVLALFVSGDMCRNQSQERKCSWCRCAQSVCILLNSGCAIYNDDCLTFNASNRAFRRYARHMANRRIRLKELAMDHTPILDGRGLSIDMDRVPDYQANQLFQILTEHDISIPGSLRLHHGTPHYYRSERHNSVYASQLRPWQAEILWGIGFRDICRTSPGFYELWTTIWMSGLSLDYLGWLLEHGPDLSMRLSPKKETAQEKQHSSFRPAHVELKSWALPLFNIIGKSLRWYLKSSEAVHENDVDVAKKLIMQFLQVDMADDCSCKCSLNGCTPQISQLKGLMSSDSRRNDPDSPVSLSSCARWYYELFSTTIPHNRHRDMIRFLTFEALGANHTCYAIMRCPPHFENDSDSEETEFMQDGESHLLETLEILVIEFDRQFYAILDEQPDKHERLAEFWVVDWLPRMQEVLTELNTAHLPEEFKHRTEEIGVVWHGPERFSNLDNEADRGSWDYWYEKLDKIVPKE